MRVRGLLARSGNAHIWQEKQQKLLAGEISLESIARLSSEEEKRRFIDSLNAFDDYCRRVCAKLCLAVIAVSYTHLRAHET